MMKQNIYDNERFFEGYSRIRETGTGLNDVLEQPALKSMLPPLKGLSVLDLGCGAGQFAAYCVEQEASRVTATDISEKMLEAAEKHNSYENITYMLSAMEDLSFQQGQFHLVVSSLALHYVKDYSHIVSNVFKWLTPGGTFIFTVEHPICTSRNPMERWIKDEEGNHLHWPVDHYNDEGARESTWFVDGVIKYHRTLSTLINDLITAGFTIDQLLEPEAVPEALAENPALIDESRRPPFLAVKARKIV